MRFAAILCALVLLPFCLAAQQPQGPPAASAVQPFAFNFDPLLLVNILPAPAKDESPAAAGELEAVHRAERERTKDEIAQAQADDQHEDIFLFAGVIGPGFDAAHLPATEKISARLRRTAGSVDNPLKKSFRRLRPYVYDSTLHPVCATNKEFSYPSGHSVNGFLFAYVLMELFPEKRDALLQRAEQYSHHRVVCGVHYPSDAQASHQVATLLFGALLGTEEFQQALNQIRDEIAAVPSLAPLLKATTAQGSR